MALPIGVKSYELRDISMPKLSYPGGRQARVALNAAKAAGVSVKLNGGKLSLKASGPPPEAVVAALKNHKAEIVALLEAEQAAFDERAAIIEFDGGAPRAWAEALARLDPVCPPGDISPARWLQFIDDCGRFLDDGWAARAAALGWGPLQLFGCNRDEPFARISQAGLLWLLEGRKLSDLTAGTARITAPSGGHLTFYRRTLEAGGALVWELAELKKRNKGENHGDGDA